MNNKTNIHNSEHLSFPVNVFSELFYIQNQTWKLTSTTAWRNHYTLPQIQTLMKSIVLNEQNVIATYKTGKLRNVSLIRHLQFQGVLKTYFSPCDIFNLGKQIINGHSASHEFMNMNLVHSLGVKTPSPYFIAERLDGKNPVNAYLFLEEIEHTEELKRNNPFEPFSKSEFSPVTLNQLAVQIGRLLALIQNQGIFHRDLHSENFLWQPSDQNNSQKQSFNSQLWLLDLQGIAVQPVLSKSQVLNNLAQLYFSLGRFFHLKYSLLMLKTYWLNLRPELKCHIPSKSMRDVFMNLISPVHQHLEKSHKRADRKWERGNRRLRIVKNHAGHSRVLSNLNQNVQRELHNNPHIIFNEAIHSQSIKSSKQRLISIITSEFFPFPVFAKWEETSRLKGTFPVWGKFSPARHAWETGHALTRREIPTPLPLFMHEKSTLTQYQGMIITLALPHAISLSAFLETYLPEMTDRHSEDWISRYIPLLARGFARLHSGYFDHRDLKSNNILVEHNEKKTGWWLIDLDAVRRWPGFLPKQRTAQNLARLVFDLSRCPCIRLSHLLRALKIYLKETSMDISKPSIVFWKTMWKAIQLEFNMIEKRKLNQQSQSQLKYTTQKKAA